MLNTAQVTARNGTSQKQVSPVRRPQREKHLRMTHTWFDDILSSKSTSSSDSNTTCYDNNQKNFSCTNSNKNKDNNDNTNSNTNNNYDISHGNHTSMPNHNEHSSKSNNCNTITAARGWPVGGKGGEGRAGNAGEVRSTVEKESTGEVVAERIYQPKAAA